MGATLLIVEENAPNVEATTKRALVVLAGAADPLADSTPLGEAGTPALDDIARRGKAGRIELDLRSSWEGFVGLLGLEPRPSLGFASAVGASLDLGEGQTAYRADFVTLGDAGVHDVRAGGLGEQEGGLLLDAVREALPDVLWKRLSGRANLLVLGEEAHFLLSPWEMPGRDPFEHLPREGALRALFEGARDVLAGHDVNAVRLDLGEDPANGLWLHGGGARIDGVRAPGAAGGDVVLVGTGEATAGLARLLGWKSVVVDGDDEALAAASLAALADADTVIVRTESVLEACASGDPEAKRDAISAADARLVAPLLGALSEQDAFALGAAADSVVDTGGRKVIAAPAPFAVLRSGDAGTGDHAFSERDCAHAHTLLASGADLMALLYA